MRETFAFAVLGNLTKGARILAVPRCAMSALDLRRFGATRLPCHVLSPLDLHYTDFLAYAAPFDLPRFGLLFQWFHRYTFHRFCSIFIGVHRFLFVFIDFRWFSLVIFWSALILFLLVETILISKPSFVAIVAPFLPVVVCDVAATVLVNAVAVFLPLHEPAAGGQPLKRWSALLSMLLQSLVPIINSILS